MARDVHTLTSRRDGEIFVLVFDDSHRAETCLRLDAWATDPDLCLRPSDSERLKGQVLRALECGENEDHRSEHDLLTPTSDLEDY